MAAMDDSKDDARDKDKDKAGDKGKGPRSMDANLPLETFKEVVPARYKPNLVHPYHHDAKAACTHSKFPHMFAAVHSGDTMWLAIPAALLNSNPKGPSDWN